MPFGNIFSLKNEKILLMVVFFSQDNVKIYEKDFVYLLESIEIDERF